MTPRQSPPARETQHFRRVPQAESELSVALALPAGHRVRSHGNGAIDLRRQVDAEERQRGVGHGVHEVLDHVVPFWRQAVIFTTERHGPPIDIQPLHPGEAVRHQAAAYQQAIRFDRCAAQAQAHSLGLFSDRRVVGDRRFRHPDRTDARDVRFQFPQFPTVDATRREAIKAAAIVKRLEAAEFGLPGSHDELAGGAEGDSVFLAEIARVANALAAEPGLEAARFVIDTGVDHAAVVSTLVPGP